MKKIAIVSAGVLPVPAVKGGAVESLIDFIIKENELEDKIKITVFSIYNENAFQRSKSYKNCTFEYIRINKIFKKAYRKVAKIINKLSSKKLDVKNIYIDKVCKAINKNKFDHVVVENRSEYVLPIKERTGIKTSLHVHNDYLNADLEKGKLIIDNCHRVLTVSKFIKNKVLTLGNKYNEKVTVLKNCTDVDSFNKNLYYDFRKAFRKKNNISDDDVVVMFSGRIQKIKGVKEIISAFSRIKNDNAKLLIVGSSWYGSNDKTDYAKEIEELSNKIRDKIIFTGFIPFVEMPKIHSVADIAVVPSIWEEPAGLVVIEAMASGIPLITTNSGGIPEYISAESAIMHKRDENLIENLMLSIDELVENIEKREFLGKNARRHILQYNTKQYYQDFIEIIES